MYRALVIVVDDVSFPILALVSSLCSHFPLSLVRGRCAWCLCQLYALENNNETSYHVSTIQIYAKRK